MNISRDTPEPDVQPNMIARLHDSANAAQARSEHPYILVQTLLEAAARFGNDKLSKELSHLRDYLPAPPNQATPALSNTFVEKVRALAWMCERRLADERDQLVLRLGMLAPNDFRAQAVRQINAFENLLLKYGLKEIVTVYTEPILVGLNNNTLADAKMVTVLLNRDLLVGLLRQARSDIENVEDEDTEDSHIGAVIPTDEPAPEELADGTDDIEKIDVPFPDVDDETDIAPLAPTAGIQVVDGEAYTEARPPPRRFRPAKKEPGTVPKPLLPLMNLRPRQPRPADPPPEEATEQADDDANDELDWPQRQPLLMRIRSWGTLYTGVVILGLFVTITLGEISRRIYHAYSGDRPEKLKLVTNNDVIFLPPDPKPEPMFTAPNEDYPFDPPRPPKPNAATRTPFVVSDVTILKPEPPPPPNMVEEVVAKVTGQEPVAVEPETAPVPDPKPEPVPVKPEPIKPPVVAAPEPPSTGDPVPCRGTWVAMNGNTAMVSLASGIWWIEGVAVGADGACVLATGEHKGSMVRTSCLNNANKTATAWCPSVRKM